MQILTCKLFIQALYIDVNDPLSSAPNPVNCEPHASLDKADDSVIN